MQTAEPSTNPRFIRTYVLVVIFESGGDDNFSLLPPPAEQENTVFGAGLDFTTF